MIRLFRLAFFSALAAITTLAFLPDYSALPPVVSYSDLANHAAAFVVLYLLYALSYPHTARRIFMSLFIYGIFIEAVQAFLPTRFASAEDILADSAGLLLGMGIMWMVECKREHAPRPEKI